MEPLLFLMPVIGSLVIGLGRVTSVRRAHASGAPIGEITLGFRDRVRYHRFTLYSVAGLLLFGSLSGYLSAPLELVVALAALALVQIPVRYRVTTEGVGLNNLLFRPYTEFIGYSAAPGCVTLYGQPGMQPFRMRVARGAEKRASQLVARRLSVHAGLPGTFPLRRMLLLAPLAAVVIALGASSAMADDGVDVSGTNVGTPEDLGCITPGGGMGFACVDADGNPDPRFAEAKQNEPFAYELAGYVNQNRLAINFVWVLITGYLVMFMQAGFAMVETGFCRAKSAMHVMMTNIMIYGVGMLAYWAVGFAFAFGGVGLTGPVNLGTGLLELDKEWAITISGVDYGIIGYKGFFLAPDTLDVGIAVLFLFQMVFMDTAATILTGAVAERWTWVSFLIWGVVVGAIVQPVVANWAWGGGWLFDLYQSGLERPYVDFAGSGVVHMVGGWAALAGAIVLGPRLGKYNNDGSSNVIPGHNVNMAAIGTLVLAFGWFGFNPGSTLGASGSGNLRIGEVAVVTMLAGASASITSMLYAKATTGKYDPAYMINGILAGLVAITAPSGYVSPIIAVIIGAIAGVLVCYTFVFVDTKLHIDDPVGAFSVHGVCGLFGVICVGLFADGTAPDFLVVGHPIEGLFFGDGRQLVAQLIGAVAIAAWSFGTSFILFKALMAMGIYRSKPEDELRGLDLPEMGTHAYPLQDAPNEPGAAIPALP